MVKIEISQLPAELLKKYLPGKKTPTIILSDHRGKMKVTLEESDLSPEKLSAKMLKALIFNKNLLIACIKKGCDGYKCNPPGSCENAAGKEEKKDEEKKDSPSSKKNDSAKPEKPQN